MVNNAHMTRRWFIGCMAVGLVLLALPVGRAGAAPDTGPSAPRIAARVQQFYDKTQVFKAGFRQRFWIKSTGQEKTSEGAVTFQKPGKMSWRYTNNGNRVVSDGKTVKVYEAENKQMYEQKMDKSYYPAALSFLVGGGNLLKSFRLRKLSSQRMKYEGGYVLEGVPRQATPAYQKILLYVDAKTSQVQRVILLDAQGNRNRFDFVDPSVNETPPKGEFDFTPPKGTQVIKP
jgi:outer membrane lipoprotein carrier protein